MFVICQLLWMAMMFTSFWCVLQVVAAWCFILSAEHCESPELFLVLCLKYPEKTAKQVFWKNPGKPAMMFEFFFGKQRFGVKRRRMWRIFTAKCISCLESHMSHAGGSKPGWTCLLFSTWHTQKTLFMCLSCKGFICIFFKTQSSQIGTFPRLESIVAWIVSPFGCTWDFRLLVCCLPNFWWHLSSSLALNIERHASSSPAKFAWNSWWVSNRSSIRPSQRLWIVHFLHFNPLAFLQLSFFGLSLKSINLPKSSGLNLKVLAFQIQGATWHCTIQNWSGAVSGWPPWFVAAAMHSARGTWKRFPCRCHSCIVISFHLTGNVSMEYWDLALEWLECTPFGVRFSNALRLWFGDHLGLWPWQCLHAGSDLPPFDGGCSRQVEPFQNSNRCGSSGSWTWWEFWCFDAWNPNNHDVLNVFQCAMHLTSSSWIFSIFFLHFQSRMSQVALLKASTGCSAAGVFTAVTWAPSTASSVSWRGKQWSCFDFFKMRRCGEWKMKLTKAGLYWEDVQICVFLDAFLATWHLVFTRHGYLGPFRDFRCPVFAGLVHQEWCA